MKPPFAKEPVKFFIGTTHERPNLLPLNNELKSLGSEWRVTAAKSVGLHIWNPRTQECCLPNGNGFVIVPDLLKTA
jgi:hypothetical protein